jgi:hypothetical protein
MIMPPSRMISPGASAWDGAVAILTIAIRGPQQEWLGNEREVARSRHAAACWFGMRLEWAPAYARKKILKIMRSYCEARYVWSEGVVLIPVIDRPLALFRSGVDNANNI